MKLLKVKVENYKSIDDSGWVNIDKCTCLVGKNESGKTAFLSALKKLNPYDGEKFNLIMEYPRKGYSKYKKIHDTEPATVVTGVFKLNENEICNIEDEFDKNILESEEITITKKYDNVLYYTVNLSEQIAVKSLIDNSSIVDGSVKKSLYDCNSIEELFGKVQNSKDNSSELEEFSAFLKTKFNQYNFNLNTYIFNSYINNFLPKFVYFDDYNIMKGEISVPNLKQKKINNPATLDGSEKTFLALLEMAGVELEDFEIQQKYENLKADMEAASINISDEVFEFWSQNKQLEIHFDISQPEIGAQPPLDQGPILHVRIRNNKHRVTVSFDNRSKGFVWFFSFLAYFSQIENKNENLILLLDEPGLSLHAKAQGDFLRFIDERLAPKYQVLYTTHSPFMINPLNLKSVRTVEDVDKKGTVVSEDILKNNKDTVFPLQAALGYDLIQTLFIGPNCLLVEGPSDLLYLQILNDMLSDKLDEKWVITPVGGADKVSTFVTLLGANQLNIAVLIDFDKKDMQRIGKLISNSYLKESNLIKVNEFVDKSSADIEDLFDDEFYINLVNGAYNLNIGISDLDNNIPRLIKRIEKYFKERNLYEGHFNHYKPAVYLLKNQVKFDDKIGTETLERASKLFDKINSLIK